MQQTDDLQVVSDHGLNELTRSLGLDAQLDHGELECEFCDDIVTRRSLFAVYPEDQRVAVVCQKAQCVRRFALHVQRTSLT